MSEPAKVYVVAVDYHTEGLSDLNMNVFRTRAEAETFVRRADHHGMVSRKIIEAEWCGPPLIDIALKLKVKVKP